MLAVGYLVHCREKLLVVVAAIKEHPTGKLPCVALPFCSMRCIRIYVFKLSVFLFYRLKTIYIIRVRIVRFFRLLAVIRLSAV